VDQHARAAGQRVGMDLQRVDSVLERVLRADGLVRQLAGLARRDEAGPQLAGERRAEDEPPRLGGDHQIDRRIGDQLRQARHGAVERPGVEQQRRDVLEDDPRPGKVGDVADQGPQIDGAHAWRQPGR
jgi:hypothetical protein